MVAEKKTGPAHTKKKNKRKKKKKKKKEKTKKIKKNKKRVLQCEHSKKGI